MKSIPGKNKSLHKLNDLLALRRRARILRSRLFPGVALIKWSRRLPEKDAVDIDQNTNTKVDAQSPQTEANDLSN